jgi:hypothetical protein
LTAIAKRETAMPTITAPPSIEEFRERRRWERKRTGDADKRQEACNFHREGQEPQLQLKTKVATRKFFAPLRSIETEANHGNDPNDTTVRQQHQAPAIQPGKQPNFNFTNLSSKSD